MFVKRNQNTLASPDVGRCPQVRREGPAALLAGWWPAYCRLAPHAILTFPLLEQLRRLAGLENF